MASSFVSFFNILILNTLGYVCIHIANYILSTNLELSRYGDFTCAWQLVCIVSFVVAFGSFTSAKEFLVQYSKEEKYDKQIAYLAWNLQSVFKTSLILFAIYLVLWSIFTQPSGLKTYHIALHAIIFSPFLTFASLAQIFILSKGYSFVYASVDLLISKATYLGAICIGLYLFSLQENLVLLTGLIAISLLIVSTYIYTMIPNNMIYESISACFDMKNQRLFYDKNWRNVANGGALFSVSNIILSVYGIFAMEIFSPDEISVGVYGLCSVLVSFFSGLVMTLQRLMAPSISTIELQSNENNASTQEAITLNALFRAIIITLGAIITLFLGKDILLLFGQSELVYPLIVPLLIIESYFDSSCAVRSLFLLSHEEIKYTEVVLLLTLFLNIALSIYLIPIFNIMGLVAANLIGTAIRTILLTIKCRKLTTIRFY